MLLVTRNRKAHPEKAQTISRLLTYKLRSPKVEWIQVRLIQWLCKFIKDWSYFHLSLLPSLMPWLCPVKGIPFIVLLTEGEVWRLNLGLRFKSQLCPLEVVPHSPHMQNRGKLLTCLLQGINALWLCYHFYD